jgi:hypothetical protein
MKHSLRVPLYFPIVELILVVYPIKFILKMTNNIRDITMSKAYDRVEWGFLYEVMRRMGFHYKWRRFIMQCFSTYCQFFDYCEWPTIRYF